MSVELGLMNGNQVDWDALSFRMWGNLITWVLIISVITLITVKFHNFEKVILYLSMLLFFMQAISLGVMLGQLALQENSVSDGVPTLTTKGLYEIGSDENIIVFIVDALDQRYLDYVKAENPELIDELDGFTYYENFTSIYGTTAYTLTSLMSNTVFRNEMTMQEWVDYNAQNRSYFDELTDNGYEISLYTSERYTIPEKIKSITTNYTVAPMHFYNFRTCFSLLYRLVACQYFPDIIKPYVWMDGTEIQASAIISDINNADYVANGFQNSEFKKGLDREGVTVKDGTKEFKFIHIYGTHEPYYTDEWGEATDQSWEWKPAAIGSMRIVVEYLEKLKKAGVYDKTSFIIMADHGASSYPGLLSNPVFMIKQKNEHHPIKTCNYEASHMNYGATIADLAGAKDTSPYGISVLDLTESTSFDRYYFAYVWTEGGNRIESDNGNYYLVEYLTATDTNDTAKFQLTDNEYTPTGERVEHKGNCITCQEYDGQLFDHYGWNCFPHQHKN